MDDLEVHQCDLFEHEPFAVDCLALNEQQGVLAVARHSDLGDERRESVIEYWNVIGAPMFHIRTTPLREKSAESLLWIDSLLFASHLDGSITRHQLHTSDYFTMRLFPSPLWCLASISGSAFCAGSDSGAILLFALEDDRIVLKKTLSVGFGAHVMSLACDGNIIAAGIMDEIVLIFSGDLLASGDSRGYITFWNASNGAFSHVTESCLQTHQADILSMAAADESLYAAGVDPTIARLALNQERTAYRVEHRRVIHRNDIRSLAASKHRAVLYSGGADYYFCVSNRLKHSTDLKNVLCSTAPSADIFSYQYSDHVVVWKAGRADGSIPRKGVCSLESGPIKLAQLRSHRGDFILSSTLSHKGDVLAVSTVRATTIYKLDFNSTLESKMSVVRKLDTCGTQLLLSSTLLFVASGNFRISVLSIKDLIAHSPEILAERGSVVAVLASPSIMHSSQRFSDNAGEVIRLHCNTNETSLVLLTTRNELFILDIMKKALRKLEIPGSDVFMDAQFLSVSTLYVLCADAKRTLLEYNTDSCLLSGSALSTEALCMSSDEAVMQMDCSSSSGIVLAGSRSHIRIITRVGGKRVLLCGPEACALRKEDEAEEGWLRKDRSSHPCWLSARKLLFTTPIMVVEPSQTAFRLKRYGQN